MPRQLRQKRMILLILISPHQLLHQHSQLLLRRLMISILISNLFLKNNFRKEVSRNAIANTPSFRHVNRDSQQFYNTQVLPVTRNLENNLQPNKLNNKYKTFKSAHHNFVCHEMTTQNLLTNIFIRFVCIFPPSLLEFVYLFQRLDTK